LARPRSCPPALLRRHRMAIAIHDHPVPVDSATIDLRRLSPGDARRLVDIMVTFARHGVLVVARRGPFLVLRPRRRAPKAAAVALRRSFTDLGPAFVKFGQLIASSPGLFPDVLSNEFRRLLDRMPAEPARRVHAVVERELGRPLEELFARFETRPIAAASIAQVHEAVLHDGTRVAVKVRRPRLAPRIERDLRLLRLLAALLQRAGAVGELANPVASVEDFAATLRTELDFRNEADAMVAFAQNLRSFGDNGRVVVPRPIDGMVAERVLVMTFVEGTAVDDGDTLRAAGHDLEGVLRVGVRAWVEAALAHGLFHGDVHAGNLFVTPDACVAFLDFGIMGRLDDHTRAVLRRTLPAVLVEGDFAAAVAGVFELGVVGQPATDLDAAADDLRDLVVPLLSRSLAEISYGEVLGQVLRVATRYRVRLPRELVLVVKQLLYFERYSKELAPHYQILADPQIIAHLLGTPSRADDRAPVLRLRPRSAPLEPGPGLSVEQATDVAFTWSYAQGRPELARLYQKAKRSQWNAATDIDWSIDVDPHDSGGLADYLPLIAADAFARFSERERAEAAHHFNAWITSQFLHGEQGALLATSKLVRQVPDLDAKLYGASQVLDEARHVEVYARYLRDKLELDYPVNPNLQQLLEMVVSDPAWDVTYLGMQIVVEGL